MQEEEALAQALARHNAGQEEDGMGEQEEMQGYADDDGRQDTLEQVSLWRVLLCCHLPMYSKANDFLLGSGRVVSTFN